MFLLCFTEGMTRNKPDICPSPWKGLDGICDRRGDTCQSNADCDRQGGGKCCFNGCQKDCVQFGELMGWVVVKLMVLFILFVNTSTGEHISRAERLLFSNSRLHKGDSWVLWITFSYKFRQSETGRKAVSGRCFKFTRVHSMGLVCPSVQIFGLVFLQRFLSWLLSCSLFNAPLPYCELYSGTTELHKAKCTKKSHTMMPKVNTCSRHIKL